MKLSKYQKLLLETLAEYEIAKQFYWTGGTLLAYYYLRHRKSFDLDFFSDTKFTREDLNPFIHDLINVLGEPKFEERKVYDRWEFILPESFESLRFEFVYYNHEKVRLAPLSKYQGILIDSLADLAANKVMAYLDRNEPKDLLDIYFLLKKRKFTAPKLLKMLSSKFGVNITEFTFWTESTKQLKNLQTLRPYLLEEDRVKQDKLFEDIKYFFLDHGREYLAKRLG